MVTKITNTPNRKPLTPAEKEDVVEKYKSGMTMADIAKQHDCHYVIIGRILRWMGVEIRL